MKTKKNLCGNSLIKNLRECFTTLPDRRKSPLISIQDATMCAFAVFKLKFPSLLEFDKHRRDDSKAHNLKSIFGLKNIPSDTQLREILDPIPYFEFFNIFKKIFSILQREKIVEKFKYNIPGAGRFLLNPIDGTGVFSSTAIHCNCCLVKEVKTSKDIIKTDDGEIELLYHHQMLGSGIVHPDKKLVIPMAPEPIVTQDGVGKNDSEISAAKRYLHRLKDEHPRLPFLIGGDALFACVPVLSLVKSYDWSFITSVKPKSHKHLFEQFNNCEQDSLIEEDEIGEKVIKKRQRIYRFRNGLELNKSKQCLIVNILDYYEEVTWQNKKGKQKKVVHFTWVTDIPLTKDNVFEVMRAGRARWKDENEIFNTLKNQGYNLEHNYGHGKENLATNFAMLANLAFLTDQIEEICCSLYQKAREVMRTKYGLWQRFQTMIQVAIFESWTELLSSIAYKVRYEASDTS